MPVEVKIPTTFRKFTDNKKILEIKPGSIINVLNEIISEYPPLKKKILDEEGNINKYISIFLNEKKVNVPDDLDKTAKDNDRVLILLAISGG